MVDDVGGDDYAERWEEIRADMRVTLAKLRHAADVQFWFMVAGVFLLVVNLALLLILQDTWTWGWWTGLVGTLVSVWVIAFAAYTWGSLRGSIRYVAVWANAGGVSADEASGSSAG